MIRQKLAVLVSGFTTGQPRTVRPRDVLHSSTASDSRHWADVDGVCLHLYKPEPVDEDRVDLRGLSGEGGGDVV